MSETPVINQIAVIKVKKKKPNISKTKVVAMTVKRKGQILWNFRVQPRQKLVII